MSTKYQVMPHKYGVRYLKNGKLVKKDNIRLHILEALGNSPEYTDPEKYCLFCDVACKLYRIYNSQPLYLCDEHYYSQTLGSIAAKLNEVNSEVGSNG